MRLGYVSQRGDFNFRLRSTLWGISGYAWGVQEGISLTNSESPESSAKLKPRALNPPKGFSPNA